MPLPASSPKAPWPPTEHVKLLAHMRQWSAWFANDLQQLQAAYGGGAIQDSTGFFASDTGGWKATVGRTLQRWFSGEPTRGPDRINKVPIPIAAQICQASADLLFSDPIKVTGYEAPPTAAPTKGTPAAAPRVQTPEQEYLDAKLGDRFHSLMAEGHEIGAALGGVYLRTTWDEKLRHLGAFTTLKDADCALPEFLWGQLIAVTFWRVIAREDDGRTVWRHLERHEFRGTNPNGYIQHGLYKGDDDTLGLRYALDARPETAGILSTPGILPDGAIDTGTPGLAVTYVPNQRPQRLWRTDPIGRNLGRSDLDGIEHLMDQLAEVMSSWLRAIRLAKARILLDKALLKNGGPGNGMIADLEQEVFTAVESLGGAGDQPLSQMVQLLQPTIAWEQYQGTVMMLIQQILQMSGYSVSTFGIGDSAQTSTSMITATEVEQRERRSLMTRDRKIREWRPALEEHLRKLIATDQLLFGAIPFDTAKLRVEFAPGVQETKLELAQTALAAFQAEAMSQIERIKLLNPDWDDAEIQAELKALQDEAQAAAELAAPPMMDALGGDGGGPAAGSGSAGSSGGSSS